MARFKSLGRAYAELQPVLETFVRYRKLEVDLHGARELLESSDESELRAMAGEEVKLLEGTLQGLEQEIRLLLLPTDPNDNKNVVLEVRAGTGGDEATLFAAPCCVARQVR